MLYTATQQDAVMAAAARGERDEAAERLNDLLLPLVKGVGSERSYELLSQSLQVLGGSGYLQDYPIEQYLRDAKIDTLYEGTTSIQGLDLFFRKIVQDNGVGAGRAGGRDRRVRRRRGRQRAAEGGAGAARHRAGRRPGDGRGDGRLPDLGAGGPAQRLQGRAEHDPAAALARRPRRRLAAAAAGRGGACRARRRLRVRRGTGRSTRARWRRHGSSPPRCCRS